MVFDVLDEVLHFVVCLLTYDKEGDSMVGTWVDIVEIVDVGSDEFEDEHDVVTFVKVGLFKLLYSLRNLLFLFVLLDKFVHVNLLSRLYYNLLFTLLLLHSLWLNFSLFF